MYANWKKIIIYCLAVGLLLIASKYYFDVLYENVPIPPIAVPETPQKIAKNYVFYVDIVEQRTYSVDLYIYMFLPNKWTHYLDKNPEKQEYRLFSDRLNQPLVNESGEIIKKGVPAKFRVRIINNENKEVVLDEYIDHPETSASYGGRYAILATKFLPKGLYIIYLDYIDGSRDFESFNVQIYFSRAHHGK